MLWFKAWGGYGERLHLINRLSCEYRSRVDAWFGRLAGHAAVALFDRLSQAGFDFAAPPAAVLCLGNPPQLRRRLSFPDWVVAKAGGQAHLAALLRHLRGFARESGFMDFYAQGAGLRAAVEGEAVRLLVSPDWLYALEHYCGLREHSYTLILAPLFHDGGYGPVLRRPSGVREACCIVGPSGVSRDQPCFGGRQRLLALLLHEFGHALVERVISDEELIPHGALSDRVKHEPGMGVYPDWRTCAHEHVVRALTVRLIVQLLGPEAGAAALGDELRRGFSFVGDLHARLVYYEKARDRWPTLRHFWPELARVFGETSRCNWRQSNRPDVSRTAS